MKDKDIVDQQIKLDLICPSCKFQLTWDTTIESFICPWCEAIFKYLPPIKYPLDK